MANINANILRRNVIIGHRKRKNLCVKCGKDIHVNDCVEDFTKTDNRENLNVFKSIDFIKKRKTILNYRTKKLLCLSCGKEIHSGPCVEDFNRSDNRSKEEQIIRPAIIKTPKLQKETLLNSMVEEKINRSSTEPLPYKKTKDIHLQRDFIIINLDKSRNGNIVEFSSLNFLSKKFKDYIICIFGDLEKYFPYSDLLKIRKLTNIREMKNAGTQEKIDYLHSCKKFLSFANEFTDYCHSNLLPVFVFEENKNVTSIIKNFIAKC